MRSAPMAIAASIALLGSLAVSAPAAARADDEPETPLLADGAFQKLGKRVAELVTLTVVDGRLTLDRTHASGVVGRTDAERRRELAAELGRRGLPPALLDAEIERRVRVAPLVEAFHRIEGASEVQSSSRSESTDGVSIDFQGAVLSGSLALAGDDVLVELRERGAPGRTLRITDDGAGRVSLTLDHGDGDLLVVRQSPERFVVVVIAGADVVSRVAPSLAAAYRADRSLLTDRLAGLLRHQGIGLPAWPHDDAVRAAVIARITPLTEGERAEADGLLAELASDDFEARERATAGLGERYERFRTIVADALARTDLDPEVRARLEEIVEERPPGGGADRTIDGFGLVGDAPYLVDLLEAAGDAERPVLLGRLTTLLGADHGDDPAAWRAALPAPADPGGGGGSDGDEGGDEGGGE